MSSFQYCYRNAFFTSFSSKGCTNAMRIITIDTPLIILAFDAALSYEHSETSDMLRTMHCSKIQRPNHVCLSSGMF